MAHFRKSMAFHKIWSSMTSGDLNYSLTEKWPMYLRVYWFWALKRFFCVFLFLLVFGIEDGHLHPSPAPPRRRCQRSWNHTRARVNYKFLICKFWVFLHTPKAEKKMLAPNVAKFRKLGGKGSLIEKIYTSFKSCNYILTTALLLSNHWPSNTRMCFEGIYKKNLHYPLIFHNVHKTCFFFRINKNLGSHISWTGFHNSYTYHLLFKHQQSNFSYTLQPKNAAFFLHPTPQLKKNLATLSSPCMPSSNTGSTRTVQRCETIRCETTNVDFTVADPTSLLQSITSLSPNRSSRQT